MGRIPAGRWWLWAHLVSLAAGAVVLVRVNRTQWFFGDEWEFLVNRGFSGARFDIWYPHNEHWSTIPILVYSTLRDTVGLGSYWPFIGVLIAVHLTLTHLLWRAMTRAGCSQLISLVGAALFAVFGAGYENLLWAFQIGFVGSLAFGWAAALVVDRSDRLSRTDGWAVLLLVCGLMCSGIGVPTVGMVAVLALARARSLWRPVVIAGVPAAVFGLWYLIVPQPPKPPWRAPIDDGLLALATHVVDGLRNTIALATRLPAGIALLVLVAVAVWTVYQSVRIVLDRPGARDLAICVIGLYGAAGFFLLSGFGRADTTSSRYIYVATAFMLPTVVAAFSWAARALWAQATVAGVFALLLVLNVSTLRAASASEGQRELIIERIVTAAPGLIATGEPLVGVQPEPTYDPDITVESLPELVADGLPTAPVTDSGLAGARLGLQIEVRPTIAIPADAPPLTLSAFAGIDQPSVDQAGCTRITVTGDDPHLVLRTPGGITGLSVTPEADGVVALALEEHLDAGQRATPVTADKSLPLPISLPAGTPVRLQLAVPAATICGLAPQGG